MVAWHGMTLVPRYFPNLSPHSLGSPGSYVRTDKLTKVKTHLAVGFYFGGPAGIRTQDTRLKRPLL